MNDTNKTKKNLILQAFKKIERKLTYFSMTGSNTKACAIYPEKKMTPTGICKNPVKNN